MVAVFKGETDYELVAHTGPYYSGHGSDTMDNLSGSSVTPPHPRQ